MRPWWLLVPGWVFAIHGAAIVIGLTIGAVNAGAIGGLNSASELVFQISPAWLASFASFVSRHALGIAAIGVIEGVCMLLVAIQFLRGRAWARRGLELFSWLGVLQAPMVAAYLVAVQQTLLAYQSTDTRALAVSLARPLWTTVAWVAIYLSMIALLRGRTARGNFTRSPSVLGEA